MARGGGAYSCPPTDISDLEQTVGRNHSLEQVSLADDRTWRCRLSVYSCCPDLQCIFLTDDCGHLDKRSENSTSPGLT